MTRFERAFVWLSTLVVAATGIVYAIMKHLLSPVDEFAVVNHPLQPLVLKLHILTAPCLVFAIGLITTRHIWPNLRSGLRHARRSGLAAALLVVPMVLTGYLVQAVTHVPLLTALAWSHLVLGGVFALAAAGHAVATRRRRAHRPTTLTLTRSPRVPRNPPASGGGTAGRWQARASSRTGT